MSLALFAATMVILVVTLHRAGGHMGPHLTRLPAGVVALDGWANRLYVVACCAWVILTARAARASLRAQGLEGIEAGGSARRKVCRQ
jgi:hypothetical protein